MSRGLLVSLAGGAVVAGVAELLPRIVEDVLLGVLAALVIAAFLDLGRTGVPLRRRP